VFEADPDLIEHLEPRQAAEARSRSLAPVTVLRPGELEPWRWMGDRGDHIGLLVLEGLLTLNLTLLGRTTMELVGAGDIICPWEEMTGPASVRQSVSWTVHVRTRVALLDRRFAERMGPWPAITTALVRRSIRRTTWLGHHLAILENPRVDVRLLLLFWQLADRWGRVGPDGVTVPFQLTHKTLGRLVRAQRPSVTASLHELSARGLLTRRDSDRAWVLHGEPDHQVRQLVGAR
jgi:CRP-like cAMP-binding protein